MLKRDHLRGFVVHFQSPSLLLLKGVVLDLVGGCFLLIVRDVGTKNERLCLVNTKTTTKIWRGDLYSRFDVLLGKYAYKFDPGKEFEGALRVFYNKDVELVDITAHSVRSIASIEQNGSESDTSLDIYGEQNLNTVGKFVGYQVNPYQGPEILCRDERVLFNWCYLLMMEMKSTDFVSLVKSTLDDDVVANLSDGRFE